jgi:peptidoglycan/LPS O-acetylase OafA/YrhL
LPKVDIPQPTGLRFLAAFSILFMHAVYWCIPFNETQIANTIAACVGVLGVPLFFVLSGFVIHYNDAMLFRDQPYGAASRNFFGARFARSYPLAAGTYMLIERPCRRYLRDRLMAKRVEG